MIIALDATPLTEPTGGVARYTWELARSLAQLYPGDQYWLLSDQTFAIPLDRPSNLHSGARPTSAIDRRWWLWGLRHEMDRRGAQLFHGTDFSVPYVPLNKPAVMTIHDLSPWIDAPWNHASGRVKWRTPQMLRLGLAKTVITPTQAVRSAVIERFELRPDQVVAVPLAAREIFHPVATEPEVPYFLFVGTLEARKNVARLIDAWRPLHTQYGIELWLVGREREGYELPNEVPGLRYLGNIDDAELPELYSGATAFVYPSLYEGFGLPVLEAMQCGCPVVTSLDPAISEVTAGAALQVDALDLNSLTQALCNMLTDPSRRQEHRAAGLERASHFRWSETARLTREVYAAACERP